MTSVEALREMSLSVLSKFEVNNADHPDIVKAKEALTSADESGLLRLLQVYITPNTNMIRAKDIDALAKEYPNTCIKELCETLKDDERDAIWSQLGMLGMMTGTLSVIPTNMLEQIEGFAKQMVTGMQTGNSMPDLSGLSGLLGGNGGDLSALASMLGPALAGGSDSSRQTGSRSKSDRSSRRARTDRSTKKNRQDVFRDRLV